ncbi:MAG: hypothetical protein COW03_13385 [Cytophagales bacterium CG12_big_fil_rev_8_21_14_0_65_40_12]|nr:MAG: hypothetical protein COW03_13385 [Cytophagales bacterium CG12_big_fil_rev_8_21_14_0_65_40_12]PIW03148.1 MAG: DUF3800 domain-containing protein [Cytophagales bacterium CG17_big_fil_post_rev_8_21_14_2_50_40_13]
MDKVFNLYIDESCHLSHDKLPVMCIGYIKVDQENYDELKERIKQIKIKHKSPTEVKWNKISASRIPLYKELIDLFFDSSLAFRTILVKYKDKLTPADFNRGSRDNFYYNLVYFLLDSATNSSSNKYRVYLDLKDTRGNEKLNKIVAKFDENHEGSSPFIHFQHLQSHENEFLQLADLFIGAVTYRSRGLTGSESKLEVVEYLELRSGYRLNEGTEPWEKKFNIYDHQPKASK